MYNDKNLNQRILKNLKTKEYERNWNQKNMKEIGNKRI
jgi:hypothetical protein